MAVISAMEDEVHKLDSFDYSRGVPVDILVGFQFTGRFWIEWTIWFPFPASMVGGDSEVSFLHGG